MGVLHQQCTVTQLVGFKAPALRVTRLVGYLPVENDSTRNFPLVWLGWLVNNDAEHKIQVMLTFSARFLGTVWFNKSWVMCALVCVSSTVIPQRMEQLGLFKTRCRCKSSKSSRGGWFVVIIGIVLLRLFNWPVLGRRAINGPGPTWYAYHNKQNNKPTLSGAKSAIVGTAKMKLYFFILRTKINFLSIFGEDHRNFKQRPPYST